MTNVVASDTQCGFKAFRAEAGKLLFHLCEGKGFAFDVEVLALAQLLDLRITEVPIQWVESQGTTVRPVRDPILMIRDLMRTRRRCVRLEKLVGRRVADTSLPLPRDAWAHRIVGDPDTVDVTFDEVSEIAPRRGRRARSRTGPRRARRLPAEPVRILFVAWKDLAHPKAGGSEVVVDVLARSARGARARRHPALRRTGRRAAVPGRRQRRDVHASTCAPRSRTRAASATSTSSSTSSTACPSSARCGGAGSAPVPGPPRARRAVGPVLPRPDRRGRPGRRGHEPSPRVPQHALHRELALDRRRPARARASTRAHVHLMDLGVEHRRAGACRRPVRRADVPRARPARAEQAARPAARPLGAGRWPRPAGRW